MMDLLLRDCSRKTVSSNDTKLTLIMVWMTGSTDTHKDPGLGMGFAFHSFLAMSDRGTGSETGRRTPVPVADQ